MTVFSLLVSSPNKAHAANPAMPFLFHAGRQWRRVANARRSAMVVSFRQ